jgi:hypothetical protein
MVQVATEQVLGGLLLNVDQNPDPAVFKDGLELHLPKGLGLHLNLHGHEFAIGPDLELGAG